MLRTNSEHYADDLALAHLLADIADSIALERPLTSSLRL